ncbi:MAG: diadenylate cyclase CdaA [Eubacteriales bacterium]|jgi:diadenylate cyclase
MNEIIRNVLEALNFLTINNVIDIAIVTFAIYKLIQLVKETRAETLVKGILLLLAVVYISDKLELTTITFVLRNSSVFIMMCVAVIFQPELRRVVEAVGRTRLKDIDFFAVSGETNQQNLWKKAVDAITSAAESMSAERVGALMVLEQDTKIGEIIGTGTLVNADISSELIRNIFFKNSPLHDGAMVIRDYRIAAAGCFLPLSENQTISKRLGTRHRAGLGMSECCDALVVIVSEETGAISIARGGNLSHNVSAKELRGALDKVLCPPAKKENKKFRLWRGRDNEEEK